MARILYGVMGDARGHVSRASTVTQDMKEHDFLFVGGGHVHDLEAEGFSVEDVPMASTLYRNNRVDVPSTVRHALGVFLNSGSVLRRVCQIIKHFDPDLILTDYEYFTPRAARRLGRPCVSLDHQHVLTHCTYEPPAGQRMSRMMTCGAIRRLYSSASDYLIVSFFRPAPIDPATTVVAPPVIRAAVRKQEAVQGDHVLVYQTSPTFHRLIPVLERTDRRFIIYGLGKPSNRNNLEFKEPSKAGFLHDLASSRYVITNGGHNVLSEALYLGKPVLCFPIANAYEQFINAFFLARLGYGDYSVSAAPHPDILKKFESRVDRYRANIATGKFFGNPFVAARLNRFLKHET
ncbi:MAG: glycosyltransferase family protein [Desulfomonilaceae bacterium]|nr:glycosyltransferase family protein [Desulfomonilaceae bacterium]